ncbi:MAG: TadE/TadG family type IV pilus assembly protein, partial [Planctomycetaceae bacterium]
MNHRRPIDLRTSRALAPPVHRRGQALLEFAVIAFVLTFLLGAMLTFGFLLFGANVLQQAADVGAMEFARHPAGPTETFDAALVNSGLFDPAFLVCRIGGPNTTAEDLPSNYSATDVQELQDRMPLINRQLFSLYIYDPDWDALRFPGAPASFGGEETVIIPIVGSRDPMTGAETITEWRRVVEEIVPSGATEGPYSLASTTTGSLDPG